MKTTLHAERRKEQRGFTAFTVDMIMRCGRGVTSRGGAIEIYFGNKEYQIAVSEFKKVIQLLDRAKGGNIIIKGDHIITAYKK